LEETLRKVKVPKLKKTGEQTAFFKSTLQLTAYLGEPELGKGEINGKEG